MPVLEIDTLTAAIALHDLAHEGNDLSTLAQSLDEDWKRYAPPVETGSRHLISTSGNRPNGFPTGLPYYNTQLIRPGHTRAEDREMNDRFLRGRPFMYGELKQTKSGYKYQNVYMRMSGKVDLILDWDNDKTIFYMMFESLPDTVMSTCIGRRLGDVMEMENHQDLIVKDVRIADQKEMMAVLGHLATEGLAIETELPKWQTIPFREIYHKPFFS